MAIADDWDFDYGAKVLSHIDGTLAYDTGTSNAPEVGDVIRGSVSGAMAKILVVTGGSPIVSGTLTLTDTVGLFETNELFEVMSTLPFDGIVDKAASLQGIRVGDTIVDQVTGTMVVRRVEYNDRGQTGGAGGGGGTLYGDTFTAFTNDSTLDVSGGEAGVGVADTTGTDNDLKLGTTLTNGTVQPPGTTDENESVIIHYSAGTQLIPEQAVVNDGVTGATGLVERQYGPADGSVGSLQIVDYDSTGGVYADTNSLVIQQVVNYDNQVAGQVFSVGDVVVGTVSAATGRVIAVVDDGDSTGRIILADESGVWNSAAPDLIQLDGVTIAEVENATITLAAATLNLPDGIRTEQFAKAVGGSVAQGGIYAAAEGLNIVRKLNSWYTLSQDTFDELVQLDDDEALDATGKNQAYQIVFDWEVPDLSMRFLRAGGITDTNGQNIWANPQTTGAQNKIADTAFLYDNTQTFHQPQLYIEQNGAKIDPWWIEGNIDVLLKVKTWNDTTLIDPATAALGKLIPGGDPAVDGNYTIFNREYYTSTYDATQFNGASGGVNTVALGTQADNASDRNPQGTHTLGYTAGSAATLLVGEMFTTNAGGNSLKVGLVVAQTGDAGATGDIEYVLKSGTQFVNTDACTGEVSGKTFTAATPTSVVAGFGADIRLQVVDLAATPSGGTGITGTFVPGDLVTQAVTSATGYVVLADTGTDILYIETVSGTFSGDNDITGGVSGSWDAGTGATYPSDTDFPGDLNNGEGAFQYCASISADITNASPETMQNVYQWSKYLARAEEETFIFNGPGTADLGTVGQFFRRLGDTFSEVKPGNPVGVYTGSLAMATGWFLDTAFLAAADIRSFTTIDHTGVSHAPPNLQSLVLTGLATGQRASAYRSTGPGATAILRTEFDVGVGGADNQAADTTIVVGANTRTVSPLPADVPDSAVLRVLDPNGTGNYLRYPYSSVVRGTNTFTLTSGSIGDVSSGIDLVDNDNVHVVLIEEESTGATVSQTIQYLADIDIVYKGRIKGKKPFRGTGTFTSTGASLPINFQDDSIVDLP